MPNFPKACFEKHQGKLPQESHWGTKIMLTFSQGGEREKEEGEKDGRRELSIYDDWKNSGA